MEVALLRVDQSALGRVGANPGEVGDDQQQGGGRVQCIGMYLQLYVGSVQIIAWSILPAKEAALEEVGKALVATDLRFFEAEGFIRRLQVADEFAKTDEVLSR